jgi:osomolarity two-component system sensor histidine kinase SLN1
MPNTGRRFWTCFHNSMESLGVIRVENGSTLPVPVQQGRPSSTPLHSNTRTPRLGMLSKFWIKVVKHLGTGTAPSTSSAMGSTGDGRQVLQRQDEADEEPQEVDEIVVDRTWSDGLKSSDSQSDHGGSPEKSGGSQRGSHKPSGIEREAPQQPTGPWTSCFLLIVLRYRLWPALVNFFSARFTDAESESQYRRENWFIRKVKLIRI